MEQTIVIISKVHYEPYPIKDTITSWEADDSKFWFEFLKQVVSLMSTFDNKQDWNYDVAGATISFDDHECAKTMPYWDELPKFMEGITRFFIEELSPEIKLPDFDWDAFEDADEPEMGSEEYFDQHDCWDAIGGDWEG